MILWVAMWIGATLGFAFVLALLVLASLYAYEAGFLWVWAPFLGLVAFIALAPLVRRRKTRTL